MPRPRNSLQQSRKRWDTLYVTEAERASIAAAAQRQNCSPGQYLIGLHLEKRPARPASAAPVLAALARAEAALLKLAYNVDGSAEGPGICAGLISLERAFERSALPLLQGEKSAP